MKHIKIYTDGACKGNPGAGGYGAILIYGSIEKEIHGGEPHTTNNRMELTALIESLDLLNQPCNITLYSDSEYVIRGVNHIDKWVKNNWRGTSKGRKIKNIDLWVKYYNLINPHHIKCKHVKAHSGDHYNEKADLLANKGVKYA